MRWIRTVSCTYKPLLELSLLASIVSGPSCHTVKSRAQVDPWTNWFVVWTLGPFCPINCIKLELPLPIISLPASLETPTATWSSDISDAGWAFENRMYLSALRYRDMRFLISLHQFWNIWPWMTLTFLLHNDLIFHRKARRRRDVVIVQSFTDNNSYVFIHRQTASTHTFSTEVKIKGQCLTCLTLQGSVHRSSYWSLRSPCCRGMKDCVDRVDR